MLEALQGAITVRVATLVTVDPHEPSALPLWLLVVAAGSIATTGLGLLLARRRRRPEDEPRRRARARAGRRSSSVCGMAGDELEEALLGAPCALTRDEVSALTGVEEPAARAVWTALGFAEVAAGEKAFTVRDAEALRTVVHLRGLGLVDSDTLLVLARAMGQGLSRLAEAVVEVVLAQAEGLTVEQQRQVALVFGGQRGAQTWRSWSCTSGAGSSRRPPGGRSSWSARAGCPCSPSASSTSSTSPAPAASGTPPPWSGRSSGSSATPPCGSPRWAAASSRRSATRCCS